jgi:transposase
MNQDHHTRITELEKQLGQQAESLRQKDQQLSLVAETEAFLRSALARVEEKVEEGEREIERLRAQLEKMRRMMFGVSSEKFSREMAKAEEELRQREEENDRYSGRDNDPQVPRQLRQSRHRRPFPGHLPREEKRLEPTETCCPECGGRLDHLGEVSAEQLELLTSAMKVIRTIRVKKACVSCDCIVEAPAPSRPIDRGIAGPGLLARIMVAKYCEHTPLYRLSEILWRQHGVQLSRVLLSNWVDASCRLLSAIVDAFYWYVMSGRKVHADDTPVKVLAPGTRKTKTGHMWAYVRDDRSGGSSDPPAVWYSYSPDWSGKHTRHHLRHFQGVLQADAYKGYGALFSAERIGGSLTEAACMAHARRGINDVWEPTRKSATAAEALARIGELYAIEKEIRGLPEVERLRIRQNQSKPRLLALYDWMEEKVAAASKKDRLAGAFQYLLKRKAALAYYCEDGLAEIDNNAAERALRSVCLGKKNWLFFGNDHGGERGAMMYSLIETCKLNGINPETYLKHILQRLPDWQANRINELLPWNVDLTSE